MSQLPVERIEKAYSEALVAMTSYKVEYAELLNKVVKTSTIWPLKTS